MREADLQALIMIELSRRGHRVFRSNAGKVQTKQGTWIKLLPRGFPDLFGWRKGDGKFFAIEVKTPTGQLRDDQKRFAKFANTQPILYGVARSVDDAIAILLASKKTYKEEDILIGKRIIAIRARLGLKQKEMAEKIGATVSALSNWENGRNKPNDIMAYRIAKLGDTSVEELRLGGKTNETRRNSGLECDNERRV